MAPRLKVFVTSDGLTDFAVATSSKAKALAAWGVRQDVFKEGRAHETDDPELVAATTGRPGEVLRRPAKARDQLANLKPAKRAKPVKLEAVKLEPAKPPPPPWPSQAALRKISDLEARLASLDAQHKRAEAELDRDRQRLERRAEAAAAEYAEKRKKLEAALSAARRPPG